MARARLLEVTAGLVARLNDVRAGGLSLLSDEAFTSLLSSLGEVRRAVDALGVEFAAELERRSADPETSLSRRLGERTPAMALARLTGLDPMEAQDWCAAGVATTARRSMTGEPLPPRYEGVACALTEAVLTPRAVRTIIGALDAIAERASIENVAEVEQVLLDYAPRLTARELSKLCRQVIDRFDPDGVEPREDELRARSGITVINGRDGLITWIVKTHPEAAGLLTAVTMNVTMTLESLLTELGAAHIDGIDEPISAGTARRLAADAVIIPDERATTAKPRKSEIQHETSDASNPCRGDAGPFLYRGCGIASQITRDHPRVRLTPRRATGPKLLGGTGSTPATSAQLAKEVPNIGHENVRFFECGEVATAVFDVGPAGDGVFVFAEAADADVVGEADHRGWNA